MSAYTLNVTVANNVVEIDATENTVSFEIGQVLGTNPTGAVTSVAGRTGAVTLTSADLTDTTAAGRALLDDASAADQRTTLGLGTAATQASTAFESAGAVSTHSALTTGVHGISAFGASLVDDANAAAARTTLGLGTAATSATGDFAAASHTHTLSNLTQSSATTGQLIRWNGSAWASFTQYGYVYAQASAFAPATTNGAAADKLETATNKLNIDRYLFDAATAEQVWISFVMPEDWNLGTIKARIHWTADSGSGGVTWGVAGVATSNDDALDVALGSEVLVSDTLLTAGDDHETDATAAITIGGSPAQRDLIHLRVRRVPSDGSDTLPVDAALLGAWIQYTRTEAPAAW